jgi:hypothetical protein
VIFDLRELGHIACPPLALAVKATPTKFGGGRRWNAGASDDACWPVRFGLEIWWNNKLVQIHTPPTFGSVPTFASDARQGRGKSRMTFPPLVGNVLLNICPYTRIGRRAHYNSPADLIDNFDFQRTERLYDSRIQYWKPPR